MDRLSTGVTLVMLALFATMVAVAATYPAGARFMPWVIGIPAIGLCLLQLVLDLRRMRRGVRPSLPRVGKPVAPVNDGELGPLTVAAEWRIGLYFVGFIAGVLLFGFLVAAPVLVVLYLWREASVRPRNAAVAAVVFTLALYLMFDRVLQFRLHEGFVTERVLDAVGR